MESDEVPAVTTTTRRMFVPSLREICISTLSRYHQYLGDVGFIDPESLREILWQCSVDELATIEDETLNGSDRNLEWYTWHLWRRLLSTELGMTGAKVPPLESPQPVDYTPPRGIDAPPGDYRQLYAQRKAEMDQRAAAAKERIAAAYRQAEELKEARKAKMIDKLVPAKRARCSGGVSRGQSHAVVSAFLHKPRADSCSTVMTKPGNQLKVLKDLGLVKSARSAATVRIIKPSPVPSAAMGHSSNLAGAALLNKATGGQLGRTSVGAAGGGSNRPLDARAAAVAAAAAARANAAGAAGSKRPAGSAPLGFDQPPAKAARSAAGPAGSSAGASGSGGVGGSKLGGSSSSPGAGSSRPDPRVMFPRQPPSGSPLGQSKFAVPTARPAAVMQPVGSVVVPPPGNGGKGRQGARSGQECLTLDDL